MAYTITRTNLINAAYCTFIAQFPLQKLLHDKPPKHIFFSITPEIVITGSLRFDKTEEEFTFFKENFIKTIYNKVYLLITLASL